MKKWDWLRADVGVLQGTRVAARCLSQFFHRLPAEVDFITQVHQATKRDYVKRVTEHDKAACAEAALAWGEAYWDGDRSTGYGGYRYDGRWRPTAEKIVAHYDLACDAKIDLGHWLRQGLSLPVTSPIGGTRGLVPPYGLLRLVGESPDRFDQAHVLHGVGGVCQGLTVARDVGHEGGGLTLERPRRFDGQDFSGCVGSATIEFATGGRVAQQRRGGRDT